MKTQDELIEWLRDAYAMEKAMEVALKKQIDNQSVSLLLREQSAVHLKETQHHSEAVAACLKRLGSETSTLKTAMAKGLEIMKGASTAFAGDHRVKDLLGMCATEHFEIACYTALRAGAARFGIFEIVETCNQIIKEEQRMADWLEANLPHVVMSYLEEAVSAPAGSDAEDDDMPDCASQAVHDDLDIHPIRARPFEDIDEGREIIPGTHPQAESVGQPPPGRVNDQQAEFVLSPALKAEPPAIPARAPSKERARHELQAR
ncbi:MAG: DUF892 family protein [Prosthecobacter sp.]